MTELNEKKKLSNLTDSQLTLLDKLKEKNNLSDAMETIMADKEISKDELVVIMTRIKEWQFTEMTVLDQWVSHVEQITPEKQQFLLQSLEWLLSVMMKNGVTIYNERDIIFLEENGYNISKLWNIKELRWKSIYQDKDNTLKFKGNHSLTDSDKIILENVDSRNIFASIWTWMVLILASSGIGLVILWWLILGYWRDQIKRKKQWDDDMDGSKELLSKLWVKR